MPRSALKTAALAATQVICVNYSDKNSTDGNSLIDLQLGYRYGEVAAGRSSELRGAKNGSLVVVTSSEHFMIGILGCVRGTSTAWKNCTYDYAREFTPITDILPRTSVPPQWKDIRIEYEISEPHRSIFSSRNCGYGEWCINAFREAIDRDIFPVRSTTVSTRTVF